MLSYQQLLRGHLAIDTFRGKKQLFLFEQKGFGRGGEFSSFSEELSLQFSPEKNLNV